MSKRELITRIRQINQSAQEEFLFGFTENELCDYLRQLESVDQKVRIIRGRKPAALAS